jgi:beta-galactosidase
MKRWFLFLMMVLVLLGLPAFGSDVGVYTIKAWADLDPCWQFLPADAPGAEQPSFDDRAWRTVDLPHDWSIEGPFAETNATRGAGGFLPGGVGWYRKHLPLPDLFSNRCVFVEFDGVMANSDVWINGLHLGHRPYGYVSFSYELTGHLNPGSQDNVLAVRADTSAQPASRWYSGAGIYRHVRVVVLNPIHIAPRGVFVTTPQVSAAEAMVRVETIVTNRSGSPRLLNVRTMVIAPDGKMVATNEMAMEFPGVPHCGVTQQLVIPHPRLWNLDAPGLYQAVSEVCEGEMVLDRQTTPFGIREFHFDADTGFWLNGKNFKIKGVCVHHDGGAFGAAVPLGVWEERLKTLKSLGVNAIRTAHNPPAPEFLDLCDRMGFLVMDEFFDCWTVAKNPYDYHLYFNEWSKTDERDTILRDRNHPSIILYSVGNEIHDTPKAELAKGILQGLVETAHAADPTRPVTQALFRPNVSGDYTNGLADLLDVIGTNYRDNELLAAQRARPSRKIIGTEQRHDRQTWLWLRDNPSHSGQFLWSGIDYLGESRRWPVIAASSGLLDRTGAPKPMAFERASWWLAESNRPMVYLTRRIATNAVGPTDPGYEPIQQDALRRPQVLFPDWTPKNSQPHDENVEVYSNCQDVELFLNGKSLGAKPLPADATPRVWKVAWASGILKAVARDNGKVVATDELRTAGKPAKILLSIGRADLLIGRDAQQRVPTAQTQLPFDWNAVAFVRATVVDKYGVVVPSANDLISFAISGPGTIAAVDSANNTSHEPFQATERHAFQGRCVAFVKATAPSGKITLTASAPGLKSGKVAIKAGPPVIAP